LSVRVNLHKTHRRHTGGMEAVDVEGKTVGECLRHLVDTYPGLEKEIFEKKGKLKSVIEVYLNGESAYPDELKRPVSDGDKIHLTFMLAGG
jgi:molybdopterin converting factor small subunit